METLPTYRIKMKTQPDPERCKEYVFTPESIRSRQCLRKPWKDGYCKTHHPDTMEARRAKSQKRFEEQMTQRLRPFDELAKAMIRISELQEVVNRAALAWTSCSHQGGCLPGGLNPRHRDEWCSHCRILDAARPTTTDRQ